MKKVLLLLAKGFEEYEASVFTDVIGWSRAHGDEPVDLVTAGLHEEIQCCWNFIVRPQLLLKDVKVDDYDALAIPGGFGEAGFYDDAYHKDFQDIIIKFAQADKYIATICVAALPLAKTGLLVNRHATTYHLGNGKRQSQLAEMGAIVQKIPIVEDQKFITSSCPSTALGVAFRLLERLTSKKNRETVWNQMGFDLSDTW